MTRLPHVVLVTGTRYALTAQNMSAVTQTLAQHQRQAATEERSLLIITGACKTGVDEIATAWAQAEGVNYSVTPALWKQHGKGAGPRRNLLMVQQATAFLLAGAPVFCCAFPKGQSPGTRGTMVAADEHGIPVHCFEFGGVT